MLEIPVTTQVLRLATARIDHKAASDERVLNIIRKSAGEPVGELMAPDFREGRSKRAPLAHDAACRERRPAAGHGRPCSCCASASESEAEISMPSVVKTLWSLAWSVTVSVSAAAGSDER